MQDNDQEPEYDIKMCLKDLDFKEICAIQNVRFSLLFKIEEDTVLMLFRWYEPIKQRQGVRRVLLGGRFVKISVDDRAFLKSSFFNVQSTFKRYLCLEYMYQRSRARTFYIF